MPTFKVADLMINLVDERFKRSDFGLCTIDQPTIDTCGFASPYMQVAKLSPRIQFARRLAAEGTREGIEAAQAISNDVAAALIGGAAMPDPNCNGSSNLPSPLTPIASKAEFLTANDLPLIRESLKEALGTVEKLEASHAPRVGEEVKAVQEHLAKALKSLG